jgi:transcriptional regulator with XRE-family HTH domain
VLRITAGLTQMQVAEVLGVSQAAYSRLEHGEIEVSISKLFALAELYRISLEQLIVGI